ncbi:30S ribosomal protein S15 [Candidatus Cytomitobacter primus]|uniref:Small ribosomal subunit protein uS15 n=1 Tax=Candidatus Cytomitobacter primus TaxID=2066024 RepID=A0A5C0UG84_9PROT|nr:30S ribosomal protein S15 [Candidatus Cytomitobacter primus]QEK38691.1 30S ribosomal protein S15 [Candidatus Cytomitobacter primus]
MNKNLGSKQDVLENFGNGGKNPGSTSVQIALLTLRIEEMSDHLQTHKKDVPVQRRLKMLVERRKKLQKYLKSQDADQLIELNKKLGLRN